MHCLFGSANRHVVGPGNAENRDDKLFSERKSIPKLCTTDETRGWIGFSLPDSRDRTVVVANR
jgi:hypothetical protein